MIIGGLFHWTFWKAIEAAIFGIPAYRIGRKKGHRDQIFNKGPVGWLKTLLAGN